MITKLPAPLPQVLDFVEKNTKWGARNRTLYILRQHLRIKDIASLTVADVLNSDGTIKDIYEASDGKQFSLVKLKPELVRYLSARFCLSDRSLQPLTALNTKVPLFPTQKSVSFTPNTMAQNLSLTDRIVFKHFNSEAAKKRLFAF